ncbi:MAG: S41 family peptidase [Bacteroidales bacterium]|nr:S41 family peptidase [Bacteroidales bacterium]
MKHIIKRIGRVKRTSSVLVLSFCLILLTSAGSRNFEITRNLDIFANLFRELVVNYIEDINVSEVMKTGIDEMLSSLDPYTVFISEAEIEDVRFITTGQYGGIGARIQPRGDFIMITDPYEGFPAHKAGLIPGDLILEINGQTTKSRREDEVRTLLQGQPGTTIDLLIERDGERFTRSLQREVIRIPNIPYKGMLDETTAYIKLTGFTQRAGREVRDAIKELGNNHNIEALVLDLRGNGGGLLHEAVNVTNLFVDRNKLVVNTKGRLEDRTSTHRTLNEPFDAEIPLVVLVDRVSASASEIVAGALQDYDRGVIIGQRTFGKGLVQNVVPLSYNTQLKITIAEYFIPSGRGIQAINYAERRPDGSVYKIPDSLKVAFTTANGRVVYDGGGIDPDIEVHRHERGAITRALISDFLIFDYAGNYVKRHGSIPEPREFHITDPIYDDFKSFIAGKGFSYETQSEQLLNQLRDVAEQEQYFQAMEMEIKKLSEIISEEKARDLVAFRPEIEQLLREEIVSRYYSRSGRVQVSLDDDPDVEKALAILADRDTYDRLLAGGE